MNLPESATSLTDGKVRGPNYLVRYAAKAFAALAITLVFIQLWNIKATIADTRELEASPVVYGEVTSERNMYAPGDLIQFESLRIVTPTAKQALPILMLTIDSFENQETGEVFPGYAASRIVKEAGKRAFKIMRRIPLECTPGPYILEGWASSQTSPLSRPVAYSSNTFTIRPRKP